MPWKDIHYLQTGSMPQRHAHQLLQRYAVLDQLRPYDPKLVGTFPLDITVAGSDLDIICEVRDFDPFVAVAAECFAGHPGYSVRYLVLAGAPAVVVGFWLEGVEVELFGQPLATERQHGYRHLLVEARLLAIGGAAFKQRIIDLKAQGLKTEPAFAQLLGLAGDPYQALLTLEEWDTAALTSLFGKRNHRLLS